MTKLDSAFAGMTIKKDRMDAEPNENRLLEEMEEGRKNKKLLEKYRPGVRVKYTRDGETGVIIDSWEDFRPLQSDLPGKKGVYVTIMFDNPDYELGERIRIEDLEILPEEPK